MPGTLRLAALLGVLLHTEVPASPPQAGTDVRALTVVTVTDTEAIFTWETTEPSDAAVWCLGPGDERPRAAEHPAEPRRYHCARIGNLRPGTSYKYGCGSAGGAGTPDPGHGRFTTLVPPPGRLLFSFATMTDTHIGQDSLGQVVIGGRRMGESLRWRDPGLPFWQLAMQASVAEINRHRPAFTIIKGDLTESGRSAEYDLARRLLDGLSRPYKVVRGNHDALAPLLRTFGLESPWYSFDHEGFHFVVLDTEPFASPGDPALSRQLAWLDSDLDAHRAQWTFVFVHRPVPPRLDRGRHEPLSETFLLLGRDLLHRHLPPEAARAVDRATGHAPCIAPTAARELAERLARHGRVAGVFAGHLHRNYVGRWPEQTGNLPYVETASTKEYPCGYAITRVYEGGYMHSYYTPADERCLEWSATTRERFESLGLRSKDGTLADRSFVIRFGELDLRPSRG